MLVERVMQVLTLWACAYEFVGGRWLFCDFMEIRVEKFQVEVLFIMSLNCALVLFQSSLCG